MYVRACILGQWRPGRYPGVRSVNEDMEMKDQSIFERINELAAEEEELWRIASDGNGLEGTQEQRLEEIKVQLDQCYDLLHQRRARRAAGLDPDEAELRQRSVVEHYQQ